MSRKILVVDKNLAVQKLMEFTFDREGFEVAAFSDGLSALDSAFKESPTLCVLEYDMKGLHLAQFLGKMRQRKNLEEVPVILMVSATDAPNDQDLRAWDVANTIKKPLDPIEMVEKVKTLVGADETETLIAAAAQASGQILTQEHSPQAPHEHSTPPPAEPAPVKDGPQRDEEMFKMEELLGWPTAPEAPETSEAVEPVGTAETENPRQEPQKELQEELEETVLVKETNEAALANAASTDLSPEKPQGHGEGLGMEFEVQEEPRPPRREIEGVVERVSQQVVEEVAWEVVPSLTEALLKSRIQEVTGQLVQEEIHRIGQEIVEKVAWEVIPPLAEVAVKKEVERAVRQWVEESGKTREDLTEQVVWEVLSSLADMARKKRDRPQES